MNRSIILFLVITEIIFDTIPSFSQNNMNQRDSINVVYRSIDTIRMNINNISKNVSAIQDSIVKLKKPVIIRCNNADNLTKMHWVMIIFPAFIVSIFGFLFFFKIENWDEKIGALIKTNNNADHPAISKFVLFLSGIAAVFVSISMTLYYGYIIAAECNTNLVTGELLKLFLGLGLGIIPYGIEAWRKKPEGTVNR